MNIIKDTLTEEEIKRLKSENENLNYIINEVKDLLDFWCKCLVGVETETAKCLFEQYKNLYETIDELKGEDK